MVFSDKEKIWIVEEGARQKSAVVIKREFVKHFKVSPRKAEDLKPHLFVRLIEGFRETDAVTPRKKNHVIRVRELKKTLFPSKFTMKTIQERQSGSTIKIDSCPTNQCAGYLKTT